MSHEDIVFNGQSFVDNLTNILRVNLTQNTDFASLSYMDANGGSGGDASAFFNSITTDANRFVDWESFQTAWQNFSGDSSTGLYDAFLQDFKDQINYQNGAAGDWAILGDGVQGTGKGVTDDDIARFFKNSFSHFLGSYPYVPDGSTDNVPDKEHPENNTTVGDSANFFDNWAKYMARTSEFYDSTSASGNSGANGVDLAAYEQVYSLFFPPGYYYPDETAAQAELRATQRIKEFFDEQVKANGAGSTSNGYFIPSQSFNKWFDELREEFIRQAGKSSLDITTTVTPDGAKKVLVIDRVLRLLIAMIDVLQRISASQAQRLSFLTTWQNAYTNLVTDVPQFARGDGTPLGGESTAAKSFRNNDANPHMNSILESVRARRSNVQDEAKATQTTINQTQDAANQQTQMATSLLQQLSTILSQIFR